jgi:hypothetical protein
LGSKALAQRGQSRHRSDATKGNRFVRWHRCAAQDFARELKSALDKKWLHFVSFSRFSRKNQKELTTEGTEVTETTKADGGELRAESGEPENEPPRTTRVRSTINGCFGHCED